MAPQPLDTRVIQYWETNHALLPEILKLPQDHIDELIDALPPGCYPELHRELVNLKADAPLYLTPP